MQYDVVIIGGGPAGSTTATLLAMQGHRVLVVEKERFPRHHVGESLLPGIVPILKAMGAFEKVDSAGFIRKYGATYAWGRNQKPWSIDFGDNDDNIYAWEVDRAKFDLILLDNCRSKGAEVREETAVSDICIDRNAVQHITLNSKDRGAERIEARYYVDATGQGSLISRKLKNKEHDHFLKKNIALYGYFEGAGRLDIPNDGDIFISATDDGWIWHIPISKDLTSIGAVVDKITLPRIHAVGKSEFLTNYIQNCPEMKPMFEKSHLASPLRIIQDWSYRAKSFVGSNYILVGDAACFIDPILSSGCYLAMHGGYIGAICLNTLLKQQNYAESKQIFEYYCFTYGKTLDSFYEMARYWYGGHRCKDSWFWKAKQLESPHSNMHAYRAFVYLAAGFSRNYSIQKAAANDSAGFSAHELPVLYQGMDYDWEDYEPELCSISKLLKQRDELNNKARTDIPLSEFQEMTLLSISKRVRIEDTMLEKQFEWHPAVKVLFNVDSNTEGKIVDALPCLTKSQIFNKEYKKLLGLIRDSITYEDLKEKWIQRDKNNDLDWSSKILTDMLTKMILTGIVEVKPHLCYDG